MNSFLSKTIRLWNELSDNIKFSTSPTVFKTQLYAQSGRTKAPMDRDLDKFYCYISKLVKTVCGEQSQRMLINIFFIAPDMQSREMKWKRNCNPCL